MGLIWLDNLFAEKTAKCSDIPPEDLPEDVLTLEEEEMLEEKSSYIPPYLYLLNPIKILTMAGPHAEINGFKFSLGSPLSPNFLVSHEIAMTPKKPQMSTGNPMLDMQHKTPFYSMGLQYHHGELTTPRPDIKFSLMGRVDSAGKVDAIFFKNLNNFKVKLQASFMNSQTRNSNVQAELEHQSKYSKQMLTLASHGIGYNLMEKIGSKLLLGFEINYILARKALYSGFALRYNLNNTDKFFCQYSPLAGSTTLGSTFKLTEHSSIATELELGEMLETGSTASLGYRCRTKMFEVNSAVRSDGDIRSMFTLNQNMFYKLKLFLAGNLYREDFRSGFGFSFGQTDD